MNTASVVLSAGIGIGGAALAALGWLAARRSYTVVTVAGYSMQPTYADGDLLLVRRRRGAAVHRGAVVVFRTPRASGNQPAWLVKRIVAVPGDLVPEEVRHTVGGDAVVPPLRLVVRGDNPNSQDSRMFGYVPFSEVLGIAVRAMGS